VKCRPWQAVQVGRQVGRCAAVAGTGRSVAGRRRCRRQVQAVPRRNEPRQQQVQRSGAVARELPGGRWQCRWQAVYVAGGAAEAGGRTQNGRRHPWHMSARRGAEA